MMRKKWEWVNPEKSHMWKSVYEKIVILGVWIVVRMRKGEEMDKCIKMEKR